MLLEWGKGNLCCLARGQTLQSKVLLSLQDLISGTMFFNKANLCNEGWPNLLCHRLNVLSKEAVLQELTLFS